MDMNTLTASAVATLTAVAWKIAGALVLWLVGRWLIGLAVRHDDQHAGQRHDDRRQQQDLLGDDPEFLGQPVSPGGLDRDNQQQRRPSPGDHTAEGSAPPDSKRTAQSRA